MSIGNLVQATLTTAITAAATVITLDAAVAPYSLPPTFGGTLILADSLSRPSKFEIITYGARSGQNLTGVVRGQEGTTAQAWPVGGLIYQSLTAAMLMPYFSNVLSATDFYSDLRMGGDVIIAGRLGVPAASGSAAGVLTAANKVKLDGIATGAQVNQATVFSGESSDGTSVTLGVQTIGQTKYTQTLVAATTTVAGLMAAADKAKLNGIAAGAQVNVGTNLSITYAAANVTLGSSTGTGVDINPVTSSLAGLMLPADKVKLDAAPTNGGVKSASFVAAVGSSYLLTTTAATAILPSYTGLAVGTSVGPFTHLQGTTPVILASSGQSIIRNGVVDTSLTFNIPASLTAIYNGTYWEI